MDRKEQIMLATLDLACEKGLDNVTLSMIADKVKIKKPSLYNHFSSKQDIVSSLYDYLREASKAMTTEIDYLSLINEKTDAKKFLCDMAKNYLDMTQNKQMFAFYKIIMSERIHSKTAAEIMVSETEKMINATEQILLAMEKYNILKFVNLKLSALSFAMTINGIINYQNDKNNAEETYSKKMITEYVENFCNEHIV